MLLFLLLKAVFVYGLTPSITSVCLSKLISKVSKHRKEYTIEHALDCFSCEKVILNNSFFWHTLTTFKLSVKCFRMYLHKNDKQAEYQ